MFHDMWPTCEPWGFDSIGLSFVEKAAENTPSHKAQRASIICCYCWSNVRHTRRHRCSFMFGAAPAPRTCDLYHMARSSSAYKRTSHGSSCLSSISFYQSDHMIASTQAKKQTASFIILQMYMLARS